MHLEPDQIQRLLHGELDAPSRDACMRHVAGCSECRGLFAAALDEEEQIFGLLREVDHEVPQVEVEALVAVARGGTGSNRPASAVDHAAHSRPQRLRKARMLRLPQGPRLAAGGWQRRAAAIVLAIACGGVAYALPGSPLPAWVDRVAGWIGGPTPGPSPEHPPRVEAPQPVPPAPPPATAGIAVAAGDRFVIGFAESQSRGVVTVALTDGPDIVVRALNGSATFTTHTQGLVIENRGSTADYQIELPRSAPWVQIQVERRQLFLKDGAGQIAAVPADAAGRYVLSLARAGQ